MDINLTWDLFVVVFLGIVTAYSFIIGRNQTLKVIAGTYVAILCSDALGNLFSKYLAVSTPFLKFLKLFGIGNADQATAFFKVLILITLIVLFAVRGSFDFNIKDGKPLSVRLVEVLVLGVLSGGLMISAMLIFISGNSLVSGVITGSGYASEIYAQSRLAKVMIDYSNFWFFMPGLAMVSVGLLSGKKVSSE